MSVSQPVRSGAIPPACLSVSKGVRKMATTKCTGCGSMDWSMLSDGLCETCKYEKFNSLQAENEKLKKAVEIIIEHETACKKRGIGYDLHVHDTLVEALVF